MIFAVGYFLCSFAAWGFTLSSFYDLGFVYPMLGTPDEQWEKERKNNYPLVFLMSIFGPMSLISTLFLKYIFSSWPVETHWRIK